MKHTLLVLAVMITLISQSTLVPTALAEKPDNMPVIDSKNDRIQNQWIAVLKSDSDSNENSQNARANGAEINHVYSNTIKGFSFKANNDKILGKILQNPNLLYVEPDYYVSTDSQTVSTGISRIGSTTNSIKSGDGQGSVDVDIAIIDTGIDLTHPDLNVYSQKSFISGISTANDDNGHGTHVAGIAAAKDDSNGVVGVAPGARLWAIKVLDRYGSGSLSNVIAGIDYVASKSSYIEVANLSLSTSNSLSLNSSIQKAVAKGITFVVAAGNNRMDASTVSPANSPDVIAVSAIVDTDGKCGGMGQSTPYGPDDTFASFSNFGSVIDIAAPGVAIYSTYKTGAYATMTGTSQASPHVAGAAAVIKSQNSTLSPSQIKDILLSDGVKYGTACNGGSTGYFTGDPDSIQEPFLNTSKY